MQLKKNRMSDLTSFLQINLFNEIMKLDLY